MHILKNGMLCFACFILIHFIAFSVQHYPKVDESEISKSVFADTKGGAGGKIIRVTNLKANGEGSLRHALKVQGPRIIVFEVGGVIDLAKNGMAIHEPHVTIAGQTAPSPGITIIRGGISIRTHDVIIKHLMVRPGDAGEPKKSGWETDGISTSGGEAYNILIDHCSVTWATDENLSVSGSRLKGPDSTSHRVTVSNCLVAEGLSHSTHRSGEHSKGSLIHDNCRNIVINRNLYAHNMRRNPYYKTAATGIIANNLIYNPGKGAIHSYWVEHEWEGHPEPPPARISIVGNVLVPGPDTQAESFVSANHAELYIKDNQIKGNVDDLQMTSGSFSEDENPTVWSDEMNVLNSSKVFSYVLSNAGARPASRDSVDQRIINSVRTREGSIIDSQEEVGGYPDLEPVHRKLTIPDQNIQEWLEKMAEEVER